MTGDPESLTQDDDRTPAPPRKRPRSDTPQDEGDEPASSDGVPMERGRMYEQSGA
jgi:hypothetical protein